MNKEQITGYPLEKEYVDRFELFKLLEWIAKQFPSHHFEIDYAKHDPANCYQLTLTDIKTNKQTIKTFYYGIKT